jgi:GNAT superfamily N-acetyltransferase
LYVPATDDDMPLIAGLMNRAYRGNAEGGWRSEAGHIAGERTNAALLRDDLAAKPAAVMLLWCESPDAVPIGCVWLEPLGDGAWYLGSFAIEPVRQAGGLGGTMLRAAEDWAHEGGAGTIRISVINVRDALIDWYERRGYVRTGQTEPFPYGDDRFGTPLRDDLAFVILEKRLEAAVRSIG